MYVIVIQHPKSETYHDYQVDGIVLRIITLSLQITRLKRNDKTGIRWFRIICMKSSKYNLHCRCRNNNFPISEYLTKKFIFPGRGITQAKRDSIQFKLQNLVMLTSQDDDTKLL